MFSCEETWDIYLTFGSVKRHVRIFKLKPMGSNLLYQSVGTLWFRLPRCAGPAVCELEGIAHTLPIEDGLDRGIDISFENPEGQIRVSFETREDMPEGSIMVDFRYGMPHRPWRTYLREHSLKVVFHFPIGIPPSWTQWTQKLGFAPLLFGKKGRPAPVTPQLPHALRILREYYSLPWGYEIEYGMTTKEGKLNSLFLIPRRLIYDEDVTRWIRKSSSFLYFVVRPRSIVEAPIIAAIIGLLVYHFAALPVWLIVLILIFLLPLFSCGLLWKMLHLIK